MVFSSQLLIKSEAEVKREGPSHTLRRPSAFSITSSESGAMEDSIPSSFSIEEMAKSLPAVALDEEGSHLLQLRFSGSEAALLQLRKLR